MSYFIQIGAGAGDQDERANYQDGFTNFVKKINKNQSDKFLIVEANPLNLDKLKICWKNFPNLEIYNIAIVDDNFRDNHLKLYYTKEDGPCYQVTSVYKDHVQKHYPESEILELNISSKKINDFLNQSVGSQKIKYLAIDVEGIDFKLLMNLNLTKFDIENISFEFIHFNKEQIIKIFNKLLQNGYTYCGKGFDVNGFDLMFKKKINLYLRLKTKIKLFKICKRKYS